MSTSNTGIQWTDATWNPVRGCSRVSSGCDSCYAMGQAHRFSGPGKPFEGLTTIRKGKVDWTGRAVFVPGMLDQPLRWKKPRRIFVNSMSDIFHESLSNEEIAAVFGVMAACPQHTFQVLTKRPKRAREWFAWVSQLVSGNAARGSDDSITRALGSYAHALAPSDATAQAQRTCHAVKIAWPLPNVHLGVSVEDQKTADERIPLLLKLRELFDYRVVTLFISGEPLLGGIDIARFLKPSLVTRDGRYLQHRQDSAEIPSTGGTWRWGLDWVIVGGESGHGARPFDVAWARSLVEQCRAAGTACFVKQLGARAYQLVPDGQIDGRTAARSFRYQPDSELFVNPLPLQDRKGGDWSEWPEELRVRQFPGELA